MYTGGAGLIVSALTLRLIEYGDIVIGVVKRNDYYDLAIKEARLVRHASHPNYTHLRIDLSDRKGFGKCFAAYKPQRVVRPAAQAGVYYSIENPLAYIESHIFGFAHILEVCRHSGVEHLVNMSSSSVHGANTAIPFLAHHNVDRPLASMPTARKVMN